MVIDIITGASTAGTNCEWGVGESNSSVSMLCFFRHSVRTTTVLQSRVDGDPVSRLRKRRSGLGNNRVPKKARPFRLSTAEFQGWKVA
jgi:hypothetical protein